MEYLDYQVVFEFASLSSKKRALTDLRNQVNAFLAQGYHLIGGVFVTVNHITYGYAQAVAKPAPPSRDPMDDPMF